MSDTWKLTDEELRRKISKEINYDRYNRIHAYLKSSHEPMGLALTDLLDSNSLSKTDMQTYLTDSMNHIRQATSKIYNPKELQQIYARTTHKLNDLLNHWNNPSADEIRFNIAYHPFYLPQSKKHHHIFFHNYQPQIAQKYQDILLNSPAENVFEQVLCGRQRRS